MRIKNLRLKNFRTYDSSYFEFSDKTNVLIGDNANGKTNLLEAIYLLSVSKSFRTRTNTDLIQFNKEFSKIEGSIYTRKNHKLLEMVLTPKGKQAKVNGSVCKKSSEFVGIFNVVIFNPDDLFLVKGNPKNRRHFIDIELTKISPIYLSYLNQYQHFLKERNLLLKNNKLDDLYFDVLTQQLVNCEVEIAKRRDVFIEKLNNQASMIYQSISNNKENIHIEYETFFDYKDSNSKELLENIYKEDKNRDIRFQTTTHGIHKDDLKILINDKDASQFASQGQQRSIVLSLKIGLLKLIYEEIGEYPVLLLDDVLSELDLERQNLLLDLVSEEIQTFITTTSIEGIRHDVIKKAKKIEIKKGRI